jgi:hypothetical protein
VLNVVLIGQPELLRNRLSVDAVRAGSLIAGLWPCSLARRWSGGGDEQPAANANIAAVPASALRFLCHDTSDATFGKPGWLSTGSIVDGVELPEGGGGSRRPLRAVAYIKRSDV